MLLTLPKLFNDKSFARSDLCKYLSGPTVQLGSVARWGGACRTDWSRWLSSCSRRAKRSQVMLKIAFAATHGRHRHLPRRASARWPVRHARATPTAVEALQAAEDGAQLAEQFKVSVTHSPERPTPPS